ncbi:MAG: preprotein translocase subunit SecA [Peptostreptococcales bacterium]|jgi:preprotein translocase subunit SecA
MGLLEKVLGSINSKELKKIDKIGKKIEALEPDFQKLTDEELRYKTIEFKDRLGKGETLDDLLVEAYAAAREGCYRSLGMKHFPVQLLGGIVLHQGRIAEMKTGEGKTLVATLPVYLNALAGKGVHVVTVNDYLAKRDMEWMGKFYNFMGLSVGCIIHGLTHDQRKAAYYCDITYGTNNEYGFDYLRDNMVIYKEEMCQRELNYAIVDEVDSILIDEARTPLIISGQGEESTDLYVRANQFVTRYKQEEDFTVDEKANTLSLTEEGVAKAEAYFKVENLSDPENMELNHHILQALKARTLMKKDIDYVVKDGEIIIVDEFTGRLMFGRRYSNGLHQAIEAKENLNIRKESKTLATITLQNYFRMYNKLAGMTGTAKTEEDEFKEIYNMDVVEIPTNKPVVREDKPDSIYSRGEGKYAAILRQVKEKHEKGQPVLVGTISIEKSEFISEILRKNGIRHNVLNAKNHEKEAEIIADAGRFGAVTIATNMAGRGTDILLGGNPEFEAKVEMRKNGYDNDTISAVSSLIPLESQELIDIRKEYHEIFGKIKKEREAEQIKVKEVGGLHIIGTERHDSRRIDNQLRGRSGRQGDAGSSQFFIGLDDDLMRLFGGERLQNFVAKMGMDDNDAIEAGILTKSIENAQKKVEGRNFSIRKYVLQYDDVMNKQREVIYNQRRRVLQGENMRDHIFSMVDDLIDDTILMHTGDVKYPEEWDLVGLEKALSAYFQGINLQFDNIESLTIKDLKDTILKTANDLYAIKEEEIGLDRIRDIERIIVLRQVDSKWMEHIDAMDQLKEGIGLRAIGNEDPVRAYQNEGFDMFEAMIKSIQEDTVRNMFNVTVHTNVQRKQVVRIANEQKEDAMNMGEDRGESERQKMQNRAVNQSRSSQPMKPIVKEKTVGRNELCPCGSGKKYKKCCGKENE